MANVNIVELATKDSDLVISELKTRYPGQQIAKRAISVFYKLPHCRAVLLWEILMNKGFIVTNRDVLVPKAEEPVQPPV
jgi:hypothetical protein